VALGVAGGTSDTVPLGVSVGKREGAACAVKSGVSDGAVTERRCAGACAGRAAVVPAPQAVSRRTVTARETRPGRRDGERRTWGTCASSKPPVVRL
jgi:hypothetical protein